MPSYKLHYLAIPGKGDPIRHAFVYAGVEFEDVRFGFNDFAAKKKEWPVGQVPVLEVDGKMRTQMNSILRYLAKVLPALKLADAETEFSCDEYMQIVDDAWAAMATTLFLDAELMKEKRGVLLGEDGRVFKNLKFVNSCHNGSSKYMFGDKLSVFDLMCARFIEWMGKGILEGVPADFVDKFPNLTKIRDNVLAEPSIAKFRADNPFPN